MAEFTNPYAEEDPFIEAHFDCLNCGGKLWEYAIQQQMVCEECRSMFPTETVLDRVAESEM
jgi:reverse gyrase